MANRSITYRLLNSGAVFDRLIEREAAKLWIEKFCRDHSIFFSVAIHAENVAQEHLHTQTFSVDATGPIPGARIIGVRYRKVRFERFNSAEVGSTYLQQGAFWKAYDQMGNRDDLLDSIKVTLDNAISMDDLEDEYNFELHFVDQSREYNVS